MSSWHGGKGSRKRKQAVSEIEMQEAWDRIFRKREVLTTPEQLIEKEISMIDSNGVAISKSGKWYTYSDVEHIQTEYEQSQNQFFYDNGVRVEPERDINS